MKRLYPYLFFLFLCLSAQAQEFKVYQFPADKVPAIDGNTHDWDCVPADYKITEAAFKGRRGKTCTAGHYHIESQCQSRLVCRNSEVVFSI